MFSDTSNQPTTLKWGWRRVARRLRSVMQSHQEASICEHILLDSRLFLPRMDTCSKIICPDLNEALLDILENGVARRKTCISRLEKVSQAGLPNSRLLLSGMDTCSLPSHLYCKHQFQKKSEMCKEAGCRKSISGRIDVSRFPEDPRRIPTWQEALDCACLATTSTLTQKFDVDDCVFAESEMLAVDPI